MTSLRRIELLVLDEVGFITLHKEASELLFQVVSDCYEQKSLIITSNLEFSQWNTVFGNDKLTAAMIDRLIHPATFSCSPALATVWRNQCSVNGSAASPASPREEERDYDD